MFGPGWKEGCPSCSFLADHFDGMLVHLADRDVSLAVVSRAPIRRSRRSGSGWDGVSRGCPPTATISTATIKLPSRRRRGPTGRCTTTTAPSNFPSDEAPGASVFCQDAQGEIFHTYSTYARGLDILIGAYNFLDLAPKGRNEEGIVPHPDGLDTASRPVCGCSRDDGRGFMLRGSGVRVTGHGCCEGARYSLAAVRPAAVRSRRVCHAARDAGAFAEVSCVPRGVARSCDGCGGVGAGRGHVADGGAGAESGAVGLAGGAG